MFNDKPMSAVGLLRKYVRNYITRPSESDLTQPASTLRPVWPQIGFSSTQQRLRILRCTTSRHQHQLPQLPFPVCSDTVMPPCTVPWHLHWRWCLSMRSQVMKTISACIGVLSQLWCIHCSVPRSVLQSLAYIPILSHLDYGNATFAGIPSYLVHRLQSVMNSAGVHFIKIMITPFCSFINYIVSKLQSGLVKRWQSLSINVCTGPLCHILLINSTSQRTTRWYDACILPCRHLWLIQLTQLSTIGDHSFPVAGARCWNGVPQDVTSAPSLLLTCRRLKSHLFRRCFHWQTVLL